MAGFRLDRVGSYPLGLRRTILFRWPLLHLSLISGVPPPALYVNRDPIIFRLDH